MTTQHAQDMTSCKCPRCGEDALEKVGEVKAPYLTFDEYECTACGHYETHAPMMLKEQAE